MACSRILVVSSLTLALVALGSGAEGGLSWFSLGGRPYMDAASLAAHLGAKLERTPDRVYLRPPGRVVTLTRGWARVEVDGRAVVLEAPVRVEQERWLVPEAFLRQVMPILAAGVPVQAAERPRAVAPAAPAPAPAAAVIPAPVAPGPGPAARTPAPAARTPAPAATAIESSRPAPPTPLTAVPSRSNPGPGTPALELPRPTALPPAATAPATPSPLAPPPAGKAGDPQSAELPPARALESPPAAPRSMVIEAPAAVPPVIARAPVPARVAPPAPPVASKPAVPSATIEDVRLRSYPTFTRVVVETSAVVKPRVEVVTPKELRIRLASVSTSRRAEEVRDGLLEAVHVEPAEGDSVLRVSFTGTSQEPKTSVLSDPPRLLFDFPRAPEPGPRAPLAAPGPLRTLVLDAGHGGHDSGAVGPAGLMEKELVLDVTRRVARLVDANLPGIKVLLSRKDDTFVPLRERTSFANRERADLFVSIHANAHRATASEGIETYFLSSEATDSAARQVAAAENSVVKLEKPAARGSRADVVKAILWDLAQSDFQQESSRLAVVVQDSMTESLRMPNRGVKQAGFYVLGGAAMPAILVEIGFVTNPREERRMKESSYRDEIARAIFAGIAEYKQDLDQRASRAAAR